MFTRAATLALPLLSFLLGHQPVSLRKLQIDLFNTHQPVSAINFLVHIVSLSRFILFHFHLFWHRYTPVHSLHYHTTLVFHHLLFHSRQQLTCLICRTNVTDSVTVFTDLYCSSVSKPPRDSRKALYFTAVLYLLFTRPSISNTAKRPPAKSISQSSGPRPSTKNDSDILSIPLLILQVEKKSHFWSRFSTAVPFWSSWFRSRVTYLETRTNLGSDRDWFTSSPNFVQFDPPAHLWGTWLIGSSPKMGRQYLSNQ